jgi:hypothetical protein
MLVEPGLLVSFSSGLAGKGVGSSIGGRSERGTYWGSLRDILTGCLAGGYAQLQRDGRDFVNGVTGSERTELRVWKGRFLRVSDWLLCRLCKVMPVVCGLQMLQYGPGA